MPAVSSYVRIEQAIARGVAPERICEQEKVPLKTVFRVMAYLDAVNNELPGSERSGRAFRREVFGTKRRGLSLSADG